MLTETEWAVMQTDGALTSPLSSRECAEWLAALWHGVVVCRTVTRSPWAVTTERVPA